MDALKDNTFTPMLRQYLNLKKQVLDCILFFRMGDFYEMFFEDAYVASRILGITLTSREKNQSNPIPMCGVPYHTANHYLSRLIGAGFKVAICEQMEDSSLSKGLVKREIIRIVSPGTFIDSDHLPTKDYCYLAALYFSYEVIGLAYLDLANGEFKATTLLSNLSLNAELTRLNPAELVLAEDQQKHPILTKLDQNIQKLPIYLYPGYSPTLYQAYKIINKRLPKKISEDNHPALIAAATLWKIIVTSQHQTPEHISKLEIYHIHNYLILDNSTRRNLEIFRSIAQDSKKGSLIHAIDYTHTPMGGRLLREWIGSPLLDIKAIQARHQAIYEIIQFPLTITEFKKIFTKIPDIPRLVGRASLGQATPRDLAILRDALKMLPYLRDKVKPFSSSLLINSFKELDDQKKITALLSNTLTDNPPLTFTEGGIIAKGIDPNLDKQRDIIQYGKNWIANTQASLRIETGIPSLKLGFNKIFGYYIEVTNTHKKKVPNNFFRKQTLAGVERYITPEIKEKEQSILEAESKAIDLEKIIFEKIRQQVVSTSQELLAIARAIATIDVLTSLAHLAISQNFVQPRMTEKNKLTIIGGRHPVVEQMLEPGEFVPNNIKLGGEKNKIIIITGPNMAGKSTILRQIGLITLLAQCGSFVPASEAILPLVDRIFTRVGAMDNIARGLSTFMVEMTETAEILNQATPRSLVIIDEVGRGTTTYDGLSIAWAVIEYLHNLQGVGVKTLFATHYHELTNLSNIYSRIKSYSIAVKEHQEKIIFLRQLISGGTNRSYGLQVAKLAGIPEQVLERAKQILKQLEIENQFAINISEVPSLTETNITNHENVILLTPTINEFITVIKNLDLTTLSPLAVVNLLSELQQKLNQN